MRLSPFFAGAAICALCFPVSARAFPGGGGKVYSPEVEKGEFELESRTSYLTGGEEDGEAESKLEAGYGFTDNWASALLAEIEREPGEDAELTALAWENVFELPKIEGSPFDFGLYGEYEQSLKGEGAKLEAKLLSQFTQGRFVQRLNLVAERAFGDDAEDEVEFGYEWLSAFEVAHDVQLGLEGFGELGDSDNFGDLNAHGHYFGPAAIFEVEPFENSEFEIQLGYLAGFGEAESDGQLRFLIEWETHF